MNSRNAYTPPASGLTSWLPLARRPAWLEALVQAGTDDDDSSDGEWVAASEDEAAADADDTGGCRHAESWHRTAGPGRSKNP